MKKIAILAPDKDRLAEIKKLLADYHNELVFAVCSVQNSVQISKKLIVQGVELIIARGESAANIKHAYPETVVLDISITGFDLALALEKARQFGENVAVVSFESIIRHIECLETALGVHIKRYDLLSKESAHVNHMIDLALKDGAHVILGGFVTTEAAQARNLPCVEIITGTQAYLESFFNAKSLLVSMEQERRSAGFIKTVLNHAYEGILSVDEKCRINIVNPVAQKILRMAANGKHIDDIWPELGLGTTVATGKEELNKLYKINGVQVLCNKVPLKDGRKTIGAVAAFQDITKIQTAEARIRKEIYSKGHVASFRFDDICGASKSIRAAVATARSFAASEANILITGETGSGKEVFAQSIHNHSKRGGPFVAVNCAALPSQLLESELFGYVGGAFTGANREGKAGLFEVAHTGSIFLDEIGELDYANQGRLLRVLQEKAVVRLGSDKVLPVDVRIIAATNKNLSAMVAQNKFREDLFYRLNVLCLQIPPLRERGKDGVLYAEQFLRELTRDKDLAFGRGTLKVLEDYHWPGNIRQLRNVIERTAAMAEQATISAAFMRKIMGMETPSGNRKIDSEENQSIRRALDACGGRITEAAKTLNVSRSTLWRKMQALGIKK